MGCHRVLLWDPWNVLLICAPYDIAQKHGITIHQYTDDMQLYLAFDMDKQEEAIAKMEACFNNIRIWMRQNKLQLNEDKTELIIIAQARHAHKVTISTIRIGDYEVAVKNRGATFDTTMSLDNHTTATVKSCNFQLRSIGQVRKYLSKSAAEKVLPAFISSRLDNENSLVYGLPDYQIKCLQRVRNTAARILTRTKKMWEYFSHYQISTLASCHKKNRRQDSYLDL